MAPPRLANHGSPSHMAFPTSLGRGGRRGLFLDISQFFDTLAGRCNSHISGILFCQCAFYFFGKDHLTLFFSVCYIIVCLHGSGLQNAGCWTSPSLFICRNTLVRGASVCSSCVLNAKWGSILQSVIDCLFVFKVIMLLCFTVFCSTSR